MSMSTINNNTKDKSNNEIERNIRKTEIKPLLEDVVEDSKVDISIVKKQFIPPMPSNNNVSNNKNGVSINKSLSKVNFLKHISEEIKTELPIQINKDDINEYDLIKSPHKSLKPTKEHKNTPFSKIKYNDVGEEIPITELRNYMKLIRSKSRNDENNNENENENENKSQFDNINSIDNSIFMLINKENKKETQFENNDEDNQSEDNEENEENSQGSSSDDEEENEESEVNDEHEEEKKEEIEVYVNKKKSKDGILLNDLNSKKISEKTKSKDTNYTKNTISKSKDLDNTIVNKDNITDFEKYQEMFDNTEYLNTITDMNTNKNSFPQDNNFDIEID